MEVTSALSLIIKGMDSAMKDNGFNVVVPVSVEKGELPITQKNGYTTVLYSGNKGSVKVELFEGKISLLCARSQAESAVDGDYKKISTTLFDPETADERDVKYIVNDFCEGIADVYGKKGKDSKKLPQPVSKAAAKSGTVYFDLVTLGSRFVQVYPELKEAYKENIEKYGEFLADDFFLNYGNAKLRETIRTNDPVQMRKLFNMLNNVYNDGTNQVQSVIVVTILGSLYDDEKLLANCIDYMEDMSLSVIETNKLLRKPSNRSKLEHPPLYKPKKEKKQSAFLSQLNGGN